MVLSRLEFRAGCGVPWKSRKENPQKLTQLSSRSHGIRSWSLPFPLLTYKPLTRLQAVEYASTIWKAYKPYRGLTGGFLLLQNFSVAISVSPYVCFILVFILISVFLR